MLAQAVISLWHGHWSAVFISLVTILTLFFPLLSELKFQVYIPPQLQLPAIGLVFASLFLGEVRGFYDLWWWDMVLHAVSGFLLAIVGLLLILILTKAERFDAYGHQRLTLLLMVMFALGMGATWEIAEFTLDETLGLQMQMQEQTPLSDARAGLADTMWDMIMNGVGALSAVLLCWRSRKASRRETFLDRWVAAFVQRNPGFFEAGSSGR